MKRDEALRPLSREHQGALAVARALSEADDREAAAARAAGAGGRF